MWEILSGKARVKSNARWLMTLPSRSIMLLNGTACAKSISTSQQPVEKAEMSVAVRLGYRKRGRDILFRYGLRMRMHV